MEEVDGRLCRFLWVGGMMTMLGAGFHPLVEVGEFSQSGVILPVLVYSRLRAMILQVYVWIRVHMPIDSMW